LSLLGIDGTKSVITDHSVTLNYSPPSTIYYSGNSSGVGKNAQGFVGSSDRSNSFSVPLSILEAGKQIDLNRYRGMVSDANRYNTYSIYQSYRYLPLTQDLTGLENVFSQSAAIGAVIPSGTRVAYNGSLTNTTSGLWDYPSVSVTLPLNFTLDESSVRINGVPSANTAFAHLWASSTRVLRIGFDDIQPGETVDFSFEAISLSNVATASAITPAIGGSYGKREYTTELIDDLVFLEGHKLAPADYSFTHLNVWTTEFIAVYPESGPISETSSQNYASFKPVSLYAKIFPSLMWELIGEFKQNTASEGTYTPVSGAPRSVTTTPNIYIDPRSIELPVGVYAIKAVNTGSSPYLIFNANTKMASNPTADVLSYINGKDYVNLSNISTSTLRDDKGLYYPVANSTVIPGNLSMAIQDQDIAEGRPTNSGHAIQQDLLIRSTDGKTVIEKDQSGISNDVNNRWSTVTYTTNAYEEVDTGGGDVNDFINAGMFVPQTEGVFFDLLPAGTFVSNENFYVRPYNGTGSVLAPIASEYVRTDKIPNWQGSGRTMLKVHVKLPDGQTNIRDYSTTYPMVKVSGFALQYTLINPYDNILDNGSEIQSLVAYRSKSADGLSQGSTATGFSEYFEALENATRDDGNNDTVYASVTSSFNPLLATSTGLTKRVKNDEELNYMSSTEVRAGEEYTYQLRYATGSGGVSFQDIMIYDVLEDGASWKGTLERIDVSHAVGRGVEPVVYYSTQNNLDPHNNNAHANLTDTSIWSNTQPANLGAVTALAFDLSKKPDGSPYIMLDSQSVYVLVTMSAPAMADEGALARNRASFRATNPIGFAADQSEYIQVSVNNPKVSITKNSDPASGKVENGDAVSYTITITNNDTIVFRDLEITDILSDYLDIESSVFSYYTDAAQPAPITAGSPLSVIRDGQKLVFSIDSLAPGQSLSVVIPTTLKNS